MTSTEQLLSAPLPALPAAAAGDEGAEPPDPREDKDFRTTVWWQASIFGGALATALLAIGAYSWTGADRLETFGTLCVFGAASVVVGAFFGFLFGVPRSSQVVQDKDGNTATQSVPSVTGTVSANTNLEQISDWLTKILVGATITQLGNIPAAATALFTAMAVAVGDRASAPAFVGALTVYSALMGFVLGWLATRVYVGWMISTVEKKLSRKKQ